MYLRIEVLRAIARFHGYTVNPVSSTFLYVINPPLNSGRKYYMVDYYCSKRVAWLAIYKHITANPIGTRLGDL